MTRAKTGSRNHKGMDYNKEVVGTFNGQVKSCRGDRQSQWKSGFVKVFRQEDGGLCAAMFLNVMPSQAYSQINVLPSGLNVKSNRVVIEDVKGPGIYVRLSSSREAEESRKVISRISSQEAPKRNKAEVKMHTGLKHMATPLKSSSPSVMKQSSPAVSLSKTATPKSVTKSGDSNFNNKNSPSSTNGWLSTNSLKRHSLEMEDGDIDTLYNDENQDKTTEFTRFRNMSPSSDSKDHVSLKNLKANSFYGKSAVTSPGFQMKTPRSRIRDQAISSVNKGLYSSGMMSIKETATKPEEDSSCQEIVSVAPPPLIKATKTDTQDAASVSPIVGFDNLGNTCFINSPLQCLAYLEPLSLDIQAVVQKYGRFLKSGSIIKLLYLLMKDVRKPGASIDCGRVKLILMRLRRMMDVKFAANTQQDAHELLSEILDRCDEEVKELLKLENEEKESNASDTIEPIQETKAQRSLNDPSKSMPNPTVNNFNSYFKNTFECQTCKNQTVSQEEHDTTMMLALTSHPELHLQDCVDNYFKGCEVEMKCEACKQNEKATITRKIVKRPRCLILNLLRYSTDNMDAKKKMDRVTIPRYISISDFCSDDAKPPTHISPAFLGDRLTGNGSTENIDLTCATEPIPSSLSTTFWPDHQAGSTANKGSTEALCPSPPHIKLNVDNSPGEVFADIIAAPTVYAEESVDKTIDDDSVFGCNSTAKTNTTSTADSSWCTSASYESASCELFQEKMGTSDGIKESEMVNTNSGSERPENSNADREEYDDGVVSFAKIAPQKQQSAERVKCRGGAEMSDSNGECNDSNCEIEVRGEGRKVVAVDAAVDNVSDEGVVDCEADDFVPVGEVEGPLPLTLEVNDDRVTGAVDEESVYSIPRKITARDPTIWTDNSSVKEDVNEDLKIVPPSHDYETCLKVNVEHPFGDDNNSVFKPQLNATNSFDEDGLMMDADDIGVQTICGRSVHDYTEAELTALDIGALTEDEMFVYAQALSRFEYAKERKGREEDQERFEQRMLESMSEDFMYDESFLEETESLIKSSSCASFGNSNQSVDSSGSPVKKFKSAEARDKCKADESSSGGSHGNYSGGFSSDNSGSTQKVPDIMESGGQDGLLCYENLSEDDEINNFKALKVSGSSTSMLDDFSASIDKRRKQVSSICQAVLEKVFPSAIAPIGTISGVLSDKNQCNSVTVSKNNKESREISSQTISPQKGKSQVKVVNNSPNNSSDSDKEEPLFINHQVQSLSSHFPKPSDLCIISPSKNRNLVKTRDYSRLRSPSASPKKKAVKSSAMSTPSPSPLKKGNASKQLRFADDVKSNNVWANSGVISSSVQQEKFDNTTPEKLTCGTQMTPDHCLADKSSGSLGIRNIWQTSRVLHFGEDEPDSMSFHDNNNNNVVKNNNKTPFSLTPFHSTQSSSTSTYSNFSSSTALFSTITTSTPILSDTTVSSCRTIMSPNLPSSTSTPHLMSKSDTLSENHQELNPEDEAADSSDSKKSNGVGMSEKYMAFGQEPKYGACAPVQDGSFRRKINRSLTSSFIAAEGKENSVEKTRERQARRKRIANIELGEAPCSYRLVGIVNHHGESLFAGHYTCSSYNLAKQCWFRMDDKNTSDSTEWTARKESSTTGYIFFYMDKDLFESYAGERVRTSAPSSQKSSSSSPS